MKSIATQLLVVAGFLAVSAMATYSEAIGTKSVYYAAASHCSVATLKAWNCGVACQKYPGVVSVTPVINDAKGTYGFVGYNSKDNQIVVSFRGSVNVENWITNIDFVKTPYKNIAGAQAHKGFLSAYESVSGQVINAVKAIKAAHPTATYLITGHSLGGALATFAGIDIKATLGVTTAMSMYTFGSPRCGNEAFSDYVFQEFGVQGYQRLTHYNDVVPHLPPKTFGFNHVGNEVWYQNSGDNLTYKQCANSPGKIESNACADSILATGVEAHLRYLGVTIGGLCTQPQMIDPSYIQDTVIAQAFLE